jgi:uncharacterized protein
MIHLKLKRNVAVGSMNHKLLEVLACPACKGRLLYDAHHQELVCSVDKLAYQIHEGIPVMIIDEARSLTQGE